MHSLKIEWEKIYLKKVKDNISLSWENKKDINIVKFLEFVKLNYDISKLSLIEIWIGSWENVSFYKRLWFNRIYWIEISKIAIKLLKTKFPYVSLVNVDMCWDVADVGKFDILIEWWVLHTLDSSCWLRYLQNLRLLFKNDSLGYLRVFKTDQKNYKTIWKVENSNLSLWAINKEYLKNLLDKAGFKIINFYEDKSYYDGIGVVWLKI